MPWECKPYQESATVGVARVDRAAVCSNDLGCDVESKTGTARRMAMGRGGPVLAAEQVRQLVARHSRASIIDRDRDGVVLLLDRDEHRSALGWSVLDRIVEQVAEHLPKSALID